VWIEVPFGMWTPDLPAVDILNVLNVICRVAAAMRPLAAITAATCHRKYVISARRAVR